VVIGLVDDRKAQGAEGIESTFTKVSIKACDLQTLLPEYQNFLQIQLETDCLTVDEGDRVRVKGVQ